jgi:hypothetical protein
MKKFGLYPIIAELRFLKARFLLARRVSMRVGGNG